MQPFKVQLLKIVMLCLFWFATAFENSAALAGVWTSGGGELIKDGQNPWFVKNTSRVSYCIKVGRDFSEQSLVTLRHDIEDAIAYWKHHFELVRPHRKARLIDGSTVDIGTQAFDYESCQPETDIVIQFGVLDDDQRQLIGDPTQFVALSVRTSYDTVNLRGKGFVYVSPDTGADRYAGDELVDRAWTRGDGGLLQATLIHEFGHIFGFSHIPEYAPGETGGIGLMSEGFLEKILAKINYQNFQTRKALPFLIFDYQNAKSVTRCAYNLSGHKSPVYAFFGADPNSGSCFEFRLTAAGMDVYQKQKSQDPLLPQDNALFLGTINISGGLDFGSQRIPSSNYVVSNLYVTEEQQVFDFDLGIPHYPLTYALHEVVDFKLDGTFRSQDNSIERIVRCLLGAADFRLGAHYDGRLFEDIISQLSF